MNKTRLLTLCAFCLHGTLACGSSDSNPIFDGDENSGAGGEGASSGGTGGNSGSAGTSAGKGGSTANGGNGTGGANGGSGNAGEGGASGDGGGSGDGGTSGTGGASGDGGAGGGGGMCPDPVHPNVNGTERTCNAGFCYCADDDGCYPDAVASSCCTVPVVCGPGAMNPVATINHPGDNEPNPRPANQPIPFVGVATDPQDGPLTGAALVWTSSELSSPIGTGVMFDASLPAGTHLITLTATDSDSNTGTDTITLEVQ